MNIKKIDTYICLLFSLIVIAGSTFLSFSLFYSFILSIFFTLSLLYTKKSDLPFIIKNSLNDCIRYKNLYFTISLIGATVAIWISSGTIASMIYYGFDFISGINFIILSFIIVSFCSFFIGSAVGTLSTVGLVLFSIGTILKIPQNIMLGAIVSGSYIADKMSALSGLVNINLSLTKTQYRNSLKTTLITFLPTFLITAFLYFILGQKYLIFNSSNFDNFKLILSNNFNINVYITLFPIFIIIISSLNINSIYTILISIITGSCITYFIQGKSFKEILYYIIFGYKSDSFGELGLVISGGGIFKMFEVSLIVMSAVFFVSVLTHSKLLDVVISGFVKSIKSKNELFFKTSILSSIITILTCDQTMGIIIPANLLNKKYDEFYIKREYLFTILSDSGTIIAPIIPWNINFIIISGIIGDINFIPYSFLCYLFPIVNFFVFRLKKI